MRWPGIFFKSKKAEVSSPAGAGGSPPTSIVPEVEKTQDAPPAPVADDKTTTESLRALKQKDTMKLVPPPGPKDAAPATKEAAPVVGLPREASPAEASTEAKSPVGSPVRRRAKLTDFARVLLPKTPAEPEAPTPVDPPASDSAAVVPAAFPVVGTAGSVMDSNIEKDEKPAPITEATPLDFSKNKAESAKADASHEVEKKQNGLAPEGAEIVAEDASSHASLKDTTRVTLPERAINPPQDRPVPPTLDTLKPDSDPREKREFILANGERIFGHVLSETADTIYLEHATLGVLTLPRLQIAGKPIEVILINGDRIVGDLIAETTECLYIRHASLGMLTVPHSQRSTRVVEAILKDGDRILGEVLAETGDFTVIRSATLGTVAVQHEQVAMLNRKIEQMQLRALPAPALENTKPDSAAS
jgi:RNase P/RNase MRP subunit p29